MAVLSLNVENMNMLLSSKFKILKLELFLASLGFFLQFEAVFAPAPFIRSAKASDHQQHLADVDSALPSTSVASARTFAAWMRTKVIEAHEP